MVKKGKTGWDLPERNCLMIPSVGCMYASLQKFLIIMQLRSGTSDFFTKQLSFPIWLVIIFTVSLPSIKGRPLCIYFGIVTRIRYDKKFFWEMRIALQHQCKSGLPLLVSYVIQFLTHNSKNQISFVARL